MSEFENVDKVLNSSSFNRSKIDVAPAALLFALSHNSSSFKRSKTEVFEAALLFGLTLDDSEVVDFVFLGCFADLRAVWGSWEGNSLGTATSWSKNSSRRRFIGSSVRFLGDFSGNLVIVIGAEVGCWIRWRGNRK